MTKSTILRHATEYRRFIRAQAHASSEIPIRVIDGNSAPTKLGDGYGYETKTGIPIRHPSAYAKRGWSSMCYRASTIRVEVGRDWLAKRRIPVCAMNPSNTAEQLVLAGLFGPTAEAAIRLGMPIEHALEDLKSTYGKNGLPELPAQPDPEPTPLNRALLDAIANATTWRK